MLSTQSFQDNKFYVELDNGYFEYGSVLDIENYLRHTKTSDFLTALSISEGIEKSEIIKDGYMHPKAMIHAACHLGGEAAIIIPQMVFDWQTGKMAKDTKYFLDDSEVEIKYSNAKKEISERQIQLKYIQGNGTITAYCFVAERPKSFRTDRIQELKDLETGAVLSDYREITNWILGKRK